MERETIEFGCNDCDGYFYPKIRLGMDGTFRFQCPNCKREHPRRVHKGEIVAPLGERRYLSGEGKRIERTYNEGSGELVILTMSAYSKVSLFEKSKTASFGDFARESLVGRTVKKLIT
jgi:hypothetical protein